MNTEQLFIRTIQDLDEKLRSTDEYEKLMIAGLLRKLLLDDSPLVNQVNRHIRLRIRFTVNDCELFTSETGLVLHSVAGILYPDPRLNNNPIEVTVAKLLTTPIIMYGDNTLTIKDIIKHGANVQGAIHLGMATEEKDKALKELADLVSIQGLPIVFNLLHEIGMIVRVGLEPLVLAAKSRV
ncbi:hypothetical protein ACFLWW_02580 [Chloroflexota bacterium]